MDKQPNNQRCPYRYYKSDEQSNFKGTKNDTMLYLHYSFFNSFVLTHFSLSFSSDGGEGSLISEEGNLHIAVAPLDDILINQSIDFIKMDIEGAELLALAGAKKSIEKNRPILAISYYHKPDDIWKIPLWLSEHCDNYKFYLRQHHYNSFDSVLYAVPVY